MIRRLLIPAALALAVFALPAGAIPNLLYDATLGSTPDAQGWIYAAFPLSNARAVQSHDGAATILDTTAAMRDMAGYFSTRALVPALDRKKGFRLMFALRILEEKHVNANRAGFSLIVLSSDLKGVELGFWQDQIWVQSDRPLFTRGESSRPFNTWSRMVEYTLAIQGLTYTLSAEGKPILSGPLKDYSAFNAPPFDFVYRQPNFLFFGDNTGSAAARVAIGSVSVEALVSVPPATTGEQRTPLASPVTR